MTEVIPGLVSTIIPVYNRPNMVREAIDSVLAQYYRPIEIIVVNDGSTDDTPDVLNALANNYPNFIKVIHHNNTGPGPSREAGRQIAKGEFIQYLDSDDILMPIKFEKQITGLAQNPDCGVAYGKTRHYEYGTTIQNIPWKRTGERIPTMFPAFLRSRWWGTSTPLYRRSLTDAAGAWLALWNEEDWEYDCRIAAMGVKLYFCDYFISDQRTHKGMRLSTDGSIDPVKLRDRAEAHQHIFKHAFHAGISRETEEMRHFARELFLLARQCGVLGLVEQSSLLFQLSKNASEKNHRDGLDFQAYYFLANIFGWHNAGLLAQKIDKLRSFLTNDKN